MKVYMGPSNFLVSIAKLHNGEIRIYSITFDFTVGFKLFNKNHSALVFQFNRNLTRYIILQRLNPPHPLVSIACDAPVDAAINTSRDASVNAAADQSRLAEKSVTGSQTTTSTRLECPDPGCRNRSFKNKESPRSHKKYYHSGNEFRCPRQGCRCSEIGKGFPLEGGKWS
ncbi:hypothetical protein LX36DRAFT_244518 [Colletotrichum falcatum]|nr:hypothetical protein LX36DRAFT_244518 [Colletotrichum falcatum]